MTFKKNSIIKVSSLVFNSISFLTKGMKIKDLIKANLVIGIVVTNLAACNNQNTPTNLNSINPTSNDSQNKQNPLSLLKIYVGDKEVKFNTKAVLKDVAPNATVAIKDKSTGETLSTGITDSNGSFITTDPGEVFSPEIGKTYDLQVTKRLGIAGNGDEIASLMSYIRWNGTTWQGMVNVSGVIINTKTTALFLIADNEGNFSDNFFKSMAWNAKDGVIVNDIAIDSGTINKEKILGINNLVNKALELNIDPVANNTYNNGTYSITGTDFSFSEPSSILGGCLGESSCGNNIPITPPVSTSAAIPIPVPTLLTTSVLALQGKIMFSSYRDGKAEIYAMNEDGSGQTRLSNNSYNESSPSFSPNRSEIAYAVNGGSAIYVINADGSNQTRLTFNADFYPSWSPDGSKIVFVSDRPPTDNEYQLYVMNSDGSGQTRLTNNLIQAKNPSWSPDGSKIVFISSTSNGSAEIYVINADGSGQTRLTNNSSNESHPSWSPDGSKIIFSSDRDGNNEIYVMNSNGLGVTRLTNTSYQENEPSWSPDGSKIVFSSNKDHPGSFIDEIYVMSSDGSRVTRLTDNSLYNYDPSWK